MSVEDDIITVRAMLDYPHETKYIPALEALDRLAVLAHQMRRERADITAEIARLERKLLSGHYAESQSDSVHHRIRELRARLS